MSQEFDREINAADVADFLEKGLLGNLVTLFRVDPSLYPLLGELLRDESISVRLGTSALVESLAEEDPGNVSQAAGVLLPLLEEGSPTVRGDPAALPGLRKRAEDENPDVREAVREALEGIEGKG